MPRLVHSPYSRPCYLLTLSACPIGPPIRLALPALCLPYPRHRPLPHRYRPTALPCLHRGQRPADGYFCKNLKRLGGTRLELSKPSEADMTKLTRYIPALLLAARRSARRRARRASTTTAIPAAAAIRSTAGPAARRRSGIAMVWRPGETMLGIVNGSTRCARGATAPRITTTTVATARATSTRASTAPTSSAATGTVTTGRTRRY